MKSPAQTLIGTAALALLLGGCAPIPPRVTSKGPGLPSPAPKKLLVWSTLDRAEQGASWGPEFSRGFVEQIVRDLAGCGVDARVFSETGLELDSDGVKEAILGADADAVLLLKKSKGWLDQYGAVVTIVYDFSIIVPADRTQSLAEAVRKNAGVRPAWEGSGRFGKTGPYWTMPLEYRAARLADELINQAIADGRLGDCAPVVLPKPPEWDPQWEAPRAPTSQ